jgi:hypothetical protein
MVKRFQVMKKTNDLYMKKKYMFNLCLTRLYAIWDYFGFIVMCMRA